MTAPKQEPSAYALLEAAIAAGADAAAIKRLSALLQSERDDTTVRALFSALSAFQLECPGIEKGTTASVQMKSGGTYSYNYAPLGDIAEAIREPLGKHGLAYSWTSYPEGALLVCECRVRHVGGGSLRAAFTSPTDTTSKMSSQQAQASALTYAKRQSLVQALGLAMCDADDDGASQGNVETVSDALANELSRLAASMNVDVQAFLAYMGVATFDEIPLARYQHAKRAIEATK